MFERACACVCLEMSFGALRNNGVTGQIEHEGAPPTLSQYLVCACAHVLCVFFCVSVCLFESMSVCV